MWSVESTFKRRLSLIVTVYMFCGWMEWILTKVSLLLLYHYILSLTCHSVGLETIFFLFLLN